jgi:hypothetical protein
LNSTAHLIRLANPILSIPSIPSIYPINIISTIATHIVDALPDRSGRHFLFSPKRPQTRASPGRPSGRATMIDQHRNVLCVAGTFPTRLTPSPARTDPPPRAQQPPSSSIPLHLHLYPSAAPLGSRTIFPSPSMRMLSSTPREGPSWCPQVAQNGRRSEKLTRYPGPRRPMARPSYQREGSSALTMVARGPRANWPCIFPITNR